MIITVELSDDDVKAIKEHMKFRISWIQAGMDEREPLDFALAKVFKATQEKKDGAK